MSLLKQSDHMSMMANAGTQTWVVTQQGKNTEKHLEHANINNIKYEIYGETLIWK